MARKSAGMGVHVDTTSTTTAQTPLGSSTTTTGDLASDPLPTIKINNSHLNEIKSSLDEVVKKVSPLETTSFVLSCTETMDSTSRTYPSPLRSFTPLSIYLSGTCPSY
jgi:hypothetical protein